MKKKTLLLSILVLSLFFVACNKEDENVTEQQETTENITTEQAVEDNTTVVETEIETVVKAKKIELYNKYVSVDNETCELDLRGNDNEYTFDFTVLRIAGVQGTASVKDNILYLQGIDGGSEATIKMEMDLSVTPYVLKIVDSEYEDLPKGTIYELKKEGYKLKKSVKIPDDKKYQLKENMVYYVDFNGDGLCEDIKFITKKEDDYENSCTVYINGNKYKTYKYKFEIEVSVIDLNITDGEKELYVYYSEENNFPTVKMHKWADTGMREIKISEHAWYEFKNDDTITKQVKTEEYFGTDVGIVMKYRYEDREFVSIDSEYTEYNQPEDRGKYPFKAYKDLTLYSMKNGKLVKEGTLKEDTQIKITKVIMNNTKIDKDEKVKYAFVTTKKGQEGWIKMSNFKVEELPTEKYPDGTKEEDMWQYTNGIIYPIGFAG